MHLTFKIRVRLCGWIGWSESSLDARVILQVCPCSGSFRLTIVWTTAWQNQQNDMCAQRRLRSSWASTQSDQSLRWPHEKALGPWLTNYMHSEDDTVMILNRTTHSVEPDQTATESLDTLEDSDQPLFRLDGCPGWSQSSLDAQIILLVLSCGRSLLYLKLLCLKAQYVHSMIITATFWNVRMFWIFTASLMLYSIQHSINARKSPVYEISVVSLWSKILVSLSTPRLPLK